MNICFLLNHFTAHGGIGRVVSILSNGLCCDETYRIHALSFYDTHSPDVYLLDRRVARANLFCKPLSMKKAMVLGGVQRLRKYLRDNRIDVLVACGALYFPVSILACRTTPTRCICWEHANYDTNDDYIFQKSCRKFGAVRGDGVVVLTKADRDRFLSEYCVSGIEQVYNPVDDLLLKKDACYDPDSKKIISVGRLAPPKNYSLLIDIADAVLTKHSDWTWDVYGDGSLREELQDKINRLHLGDQLRLKGRADDIYDLYGHYAFFVMTSKREGFPMALIEASASSLPLVAFDIATGPDEIIEEGKNGYLIEPFAAEKMIMRIEEMVSDRNLRLALSKTGRELCKRFSQEHFLAEWKRILEGVMQ